MIKIELGEVWGWNHALRGMRNPMNSWDRSDSDLYRGMIGKNDADLMRRLFNGGSVHRKFLRQIFISMDIIAPLYWWKEFDTYKVGTTANSCSTMHKLTAKPFELDDFSTDHLEDPSTARSLMNKTIEVLNLLRKVYLDGNQVYEKHSKKIWYEMIQLLPTSYNQRRTVTMNYENAVTMIEQRSGHKLDEWNEFVSQLKLLPFMDIFYADQKEGDQS